MKHSFTALCWAVIVLGVLLACTKKPAPTKPGPAPAKDYGSETALADVGRGRDLSEMGFQKQAGSIAFTPVYFALNGVEPMSESAEALRAIAAQAPRYRSCVVEGHACPLGSDVYNMALGYHRAQAVVAHLRRAGVRTGLQVSTRGEEEPVTEDLERYALNRRVVVECLK